jgi:hypothetical protein
MLSNYFSYRTNDEMKFSIEKEVIQRIPKEHLEPIFEFELDEKFAMHFSELVNGDYRVINDDELKVLKRLRNFLHENNLAQNSSRRKSRMHNIKNISRQSP